MAEPPYVTGGLSMLQGYVGAWLKGARQLDDPELRAFIRAYQRRALRVGKARPWPRSTRRKQERWPPGGDGRQDDIGVSSRLCAQAAGRNAPMTVPPFRCIPKKVVSRPKPGSVLTIAAEPVCGAARGTVAGLAVVPAEPMRESDMSRSPPRW